MCSTNLIRWTIALAGTFAAVAGGQAPVRGEEVAAEAIRVVRQFVLPVDPAADSHDVSLRLRVVWLRDTRWTEARLRSMLTEAEQILAQCGIGFAPVVVDVVRAPEHLRDLDSRASRALMATVDPPRPAVVLVEGTRNRPAFEAEAFGRGNTRTRPELTDSVWLTADIRDPGIALAHELVHVLANSGVHVAAPGNLMQPETRPGQTALTLDQCSHVVGAGIANGLLTARSPR